MSELGAMAHRTVEDLKTAYPDAAWRERYAEICDLVELLATCIIGDKYTISDALGNAIVLSDAGTAVRTRLARKNSVGPKEAKLMCALALGHDELFIDVEKTDPDALAAAIDAEILDGRIRLPMIFGRQFYDRYAQLFEDEKDLLSTDETLTVLDDLPVGVFQYGFFTTGPYGLRRAPTSRNLQATRRVPAFHCSRAGCRTLHPVQLETSSSAPVNRDRDKLEQLLRTFEGDPAEWWAFAGEASGSARAYYGDQASGCHIPLVGDALDLEELQTLLTELLNEKGGSLRKAISGFVRVASAEEAVSGLDRAQILQLILFSSERSIATALDRLVQRRAILVPPGEVRRPITTAGMRSGAFGLRAELSSHGVRFVSDEPGFALLRERRLLDALYVRDLSTDVEELEWQLRGIDVTDIDERLEHFFQERSPKAVLERLVLARKTNMVAACEEVGIEGGESMPDDVLVDTLLWKLGFPVLVDEDPHRNFWAYHERLWALAQSSEIGASDRFLEAASPYFNSLEGLLLDSLAFTSWALLSDHVMANAPFSYDDDLDRRGGLQLLGSFAASPAGTANYESDRVDLGNLIGGFSALARRLEEVVRDSDSYRRPAAEIPEFDGKTRIKEFRLRSTAAFLDLTPPSQARILEGLRDITTTMTAADVNLVRNDYAHYRRTPPDIAKLEAALEATRRAVTRIEALGFCRILFWPTGVSRDEWGRSLHDFAGPRSFEHTFSRPTRFDWMGLPSIHEPAYLIRSAAVGEPTEVLRFTRRLRSRYLDMWAGFPDRRRRTRVKSMDESDTFSGKHDRAGKA
ncbi:MAG: hypothetical protein ABW025_07805 [Cellulomonas sp.]